MATALGEPLSYGKQEPMLLSTHFPVMITENETAAEAVLNPGLGKGLH
jgi:hypothetical protein